MFKKVVAILALVLVGLGAFAKRNLELNTGFPIANIFFENEDSKHSQTACGFSAGFGKFRFEEYSPFTMGFFINVQTPSIIKTKTEGVSENYRIKDIYNSYIVMDMFVGPTFRVFSNDNFNLIVLVGSHVGIHFNERLDGDKLLCDLFSFIGPSLGLGINYNIHESIYLTGKLTGAYDFVFAGEYGSKNAIFIIPLVGIGFNF